MGHEWCRHRQVQLVVWLFALPLCVVNLSIAQMVEQVCHEIGVCLKLPNGWSHLKGDAQKQGCMFAKGKEAFLYLLIPKGDGRWTANLLLSSMLKELKERNPGLEVTSKKEVYALDSGFVLIATLRRSAEDGVQVFVWAAAIVVGRKLIGAVCTSMPNIADAIKSEMLTILRSLREIDRNEGAKIRLPLPEGEFIVSVEPQANEPIVTKPALPTQPSSVVHRHSLKEFRRIIPTPIAIDPLQSAQERKASQMLELTPDEAGICRLPWLGIQLRLPNGWKVMLVQQIPQLGTTVTFCIVGESINGFMPTLSISFIPTVVGLALPKDTIEAAKQIARTFLLPLGWKQMGNWKELASQDGRGVMSLFETPSAVGAPKTHAWVACMIFHGKGYAAMIVGTCRCDGHDKLHEVYHRIVTSMCFERGSK